MDNTLTTNIYIFLLAMVLAIMEIQIEGSHRWAKNLPTWRPKKANAAILFYEGLMEGKELTGYHLTIYLFIFMLFQLPYFFGYGLTIEHLARTLSLFVLFLPLWDFLWLVLNPHYPLKKFKEEHIWWHKTWVLGLPIAYYWGAAISLLIVLFGMIMGGSTTLFHWWVTNIILFTVETCIIILFTVNVLRIDNWTAKPGSFRSFRGL